MPQIIVTADGSDDRDGRAVMLRERITVGDFDSERFAANLVERLGWAVLDATEIEQTHETDYRATRRRVPAGAPAREPAHV